MLIPPSSDEILNLSDEIVWWARSVSERCVSMGVRGEFTADVLKALGIKNVDVPLIIQRKNNDNQVVYAKARISASLDSNFKGTHMSRFMEILNEWREKELLGIDIKGDQL